MTERENGQFFVARTIDLLTEGMVDLFVLRIIDLLTDVMVDLFVFVSTDRIVQFKLNAQSLRLFGLHSDVNDAYRAGANRFKNKQTISSHPTIFCVSWSVFLKYDFIFLPFSLSFNEYGCRPI